MSPGTSTVPGSGPNAEGPSAVSFRPNETRDALLRIGRIVAQPYSREDASGLGEMKASGSGD